MKKFYYKKADSLDKTPIILRLDRCHTVSASENGLKRPTGRYSSRATSISSLEQLKNAPSPTKTRMREATKSLSEDIFNCYSTPSAVVITETELSSSWLYKNMKAVTNCQAENETSKASIISNAQQPPQESLSPVVLQDPKLKPIPIKKRSRCCHMTIITAICICILGFISTIGTVIYLEKFNHISQTAFSMTQPGNSRVIHPPQKGLLDLDGENKSPKKLNEAPKSIRNSVTSIQRKTIGFVDFDGQDSTHLTKFVDNAKTEIGLFEDSKYGEKTSNSSGHDEARHGIEFSNENFNSRVMLENFVDQMDNFTELIAKGLNPSGAETDPASVTNVYEENGSQPNLIESDAFFPLDQVDDWSEVNVGAAMRIPGEATRTTKPEDSRKGNRGNLVAENGGRMLSIENNRALESEETSLANADNDPDENRQTVRTVNGGPVQEASRIGHGLAAVAEKSPLPENRPSKKSVNMQVSLAEAMERFKVLDDRFPSLRVKSGAPKNGERKSGSDAESRVKEQMQYLSKLRLYLYNRMQ